MTVILAMGLFSTAGFAQVQRKATPENATPPQSNTQTQPGNDLSKREERKGLMQELNLTKEQHQKMKEIREAAKAKHDALMADTKLTDPERKQKMKEIHEQQEKDIDAILTPEQRVKMDAIRKEMKDRRMNTPHMNSNAPAAQGAPAANPAASQN